MRLIIPTILLLAVVSSAVAQIKPADDAPQPKSPQESASLMALPEGFRIELVASEPLIQEPSCVAFDEFGRMFVTELHGYNVEGELDVAELNKTGKLDKEVRRLRWEFMDGDIAKKAAKLQYGVVKMLTDTDGDGRMDKADVWANDLPPAYGVVPARGGIIVVAAPDIVFIKDKDGDGKPDHRETLFTGFTVRTLERGINNPRWGIDNWIYVGAGGEGGTITGPRLKEPVKLRHSDFRIKADGTAIEPVTGRVGTFGLTMNDNGDRFPCSGGQPAIYALPLDYNDLLRNPYVATPSTNHSAANYGNGFRISQPHPWRVRRRQDPAWIKFYGDRETNSNYFTGGCGGEIYTADAFPKKYRDCFYYCEPSLNIVHRCVLSRDGAGYKGGRATEDQKKEFLASKDQWFRPMNLRTGPEGALYIVDMYREIIEDYSAIPRFLQQQYGLDKGRDRGRIWRLLPKEVETQPLPKLAEMDAEDLVECLGHPNPWWRKTAQRILVESQERIPPDAHSRLQKIQLDDDNPLGRIHAMYTRTEIANPGLGSNEDLASCLTSKDHRVRLNALRVAQTELLDTLQTLGDGKSRFLLSMVEDPDPAVRLQLAISIGHVSQDIAEQVLVKLAREHGAERWMDAAILSSSTDLADELLVALLENPPQQAASLFRPLASTVMGRRIEEELSNVLASIPHAAVDHQKLCLQGLADRAKQGDKLNLSANAQQAIETLFKSSSPQIVSLMVNVAPQLISTDHPTLKEIYAAAERAAESSDPVQQKWALSVLDGAPFERVAPVASRLTGSKQTPEIQMAAIACMNSCDDDRIAQKLLEGWPTFSPTARKQVLDAIIQRQNRWTVLLDAIESKTLRAGDLSASQQQQLANADDKTIVARAKQLFENPATNTELKARFESYMAALAGKPDISNGESVFNKTCVNCHKAPDSKSGHDVGPALGSVTNKPDVAILMSILDPSSNIDAEYANYIVQTESGKSFSGVLSSESPTSVTLKMEKGTTETILRQDIELMRASPVSLMPADLHKQIDAIGMRDLLGFLRTRFQAAKSE